VRYSEILVKNRRFEPTPRLWSLSYTDAIQSRLLLLLLLFILILLLFAAYMTVSSWL